MTKGQNAWYDMYQTVSTICDDQNALWTDKDYFKLPYTDFQNNLIAIQQAMIVQMTDTTGYTEAKGSTRIALEDQIRSLGAALTSYAIQEKDKALEREVDYTSSEILKATDNAVIGIAEILEARATKHLAALAEWKITATEMAAFSAAKAELIEKMQPQQKVFVAAGKATQTLKDLFKDSNRILKEHMDPAAKALKAFSQDFYDSYTIARKIDDAKTGTRAFQLHVADSGSNDPLEGVQVSIEPASIGRVTSSLGNCWVQNLPAGPITVRLVKQGWETLDLEGHINDGETTRLIALMTKV